MNVPRFKPLTEVSCVKRSVFASRLSSCVRITQVNLPTQTSGVIAVKT